MNNFEGCPAAALFYWRTLLAYPLLEFAFSAADRVRFL